MVPLKQRREQPVNGLEQPVEQGKGAAVGQGDLLADLQGLEKVVPDRKDGGVAAEPDAVFKLEIETPVVQVSAAHRGVEIIRHHGLAVDKTGGKLVDASPRLQ